MRLAAELKDAEMQIRSPHLELPAATRHKLESYRRRVWWVKLAEGMLAGLFGLLLSYLLMFALDRIWETPSWLRAVMMVAGVLGLGIVFPLKWHRWVWRTRRLEQAARLLRHKFPRIGDQLLGIVELAHNELEQERSESLCRAAMRQVDQSIRDCDFTRAVPAPRHRLWGWAAGIALVLSALALTIVPAAGINALARWLMPWRQIDRYTFVQLQDLPDKLVVPYAEPFTIRAELASQTAWSPREAAARYGGQAALRAPLTDRRYEFSIPPQKTPDELTVSAGDAKKRLLVEPTPRPELKAIRALIRLPEYLQHAEELQQDVRSGSLSVVAGSSFRIRAQTTRPLIEASVDGTPVDVRQDTFTVPNKVVATSAMHKLNWRDALGLTSKDPFVLHVAALVDEAPTITGRKLQRERVVLSTDVLSFGVLAQDDFGVRLVGLEWAGIEDPLRNPQPERGEKTVAAGGPRERTLELRSTFSAQREGIRPQSLEVRLFALDYLPGRERVYSPTYVVHVLSPEEHAIWLTRQMRQWLRQSQEVYEREQQLVETNRELRALSPEEIDRPQNRQRIEAQAAKEQSNAQRLDSLTRSGEELIRQAVRNEQFNVATLESWADMLQGLKDIARNRMPSVADLLTEAVEAPGQSPTAPSDKESRPPGDPSPQVGVSRDSRSTHSSGKSDKVPAIVDIESGFNELDDTQADNRPAPASGAARLKLPATAVLGGGAKQEGSSGTSPAQELVAQAVTAQEDLLEEFSRIADELKKILGNLEGSTFVKRLKAASRKQLEVAGELNKLLAGTFGFSEFGLHEPDQPTAEIAKREVAHGDEVYVIEQDLEAYFNRVQEGKFKTVLNEMKDSQVVSNLHRVAAAMRDDLHGQSLAQSEFWADTLDRWAEQLVGPG